MKITTDRWHRRALLRGAALAGAAGLVGLRSEGALAEPPPETRRLRVYQIGAICAAPSLLAAEELLRGEGFTDVVDVATEGSTDVFKALSSGKADMALDFIGGHIIQVDKGAPIVVLGPGHIGCSELFGTDRVRAIRDLKGKTVALAELGPGSMQHLIVASMATYLGMDPRKDIKFVVHPDDMAIRLLAEGKIDAYLGFPPTSLELRARKIGHVVVNTLVDRPWSQYYCCVIIGNREFVRKHPVATKRALRAFLKATDLCSREPERVVRVLIDKGWTKQYDYALQAIRETPYGKWRDYDLEDSVRFWALRLHEAGFIKSNPKKIIGQSTDMRFFNELKKELKG